MFILFVLIPFRHHPAADPFYIQFYSRVSFTIDLVTALLVYDFVRPITAFIAQNKFRSLAQARLRRFFITVM